MVNRIPTWGGSKRVKQWEGQRENISLSHYGCKTLILIMDIKFLHPPLYPDLCPHLMGSSQTHPPSFLQVPWYSNHSVFFVQSWWQTNPPTNWPRWKNNLPGRGNNGGRRKSRWVGGGIRSDATWWIYLQGWIFTLSQTTHHLLKVFLKGCTWVCRPSKLFWNKQKQTCRQLESKKQNNMHYSWPDCIQRLLEEIDNLTHIHWCQIPTHDRSSRYQGEALGYCCMCRCVYPCLCF